MVEEKKKRAPEEIVNVGYPFQDFLFNDFTGRIYIRFLYGAAPVVRSGQYVRIVGRVTGSPPQTWSKHVTVVRVSTHVWENCFIGWHEWMGEVLATTSNPKITQLTNKLAS